MTKVDEEKYPVTVSLWMADEGMYEDENVMHNNKEIAKDYGDNPEVQYMRADYVAELVKGSTQGHADNVKCLNAEIEELKLALLSSMDDQHTAVKYRAIATAEGDLLRDELRRISTTNRGQRMAITRVIKEGEALWKTTK